MSIKNLTKNKILVEKTQICKNSLQKALGLMFKKEIKQALVFPFQKEKKVPLHMFFVFFPIDVLYIDRNKQVVEIKENFKPCTIYSPKHKAQYVIELPKGTIKKSKTAIGDKLDF